jgi:SAM-dependent methyltransferase
MSSEERFGYEWDKYSQIDENYENQFKNWVFPLDTKDFQGKKVLDAGCGMGRNSYWSLKWGAENLTAFDFDKRSVNAAKNTLRSFSNTDVVYKNIYEIDWQNEFDLVFSIGVIHHLDKPKQALENLIRALKPGGILVLWLYSRVGYDWIIKYVNPIRKKITSRLPLSLVHLITYFFSVPLWLFLKIFKGPSSYLKQLSTFNFWHLHSIVFDQLIPEVANYWSREEVEDLLKDLNLKNIDIHQPPNGNGWTVIAKKI